MKALTLHEPWAALIRAGYKEVETREWYTGYRGPLAIHSAKRKPDSLSLSQITFALASKGCLPPWYPDWHANGAEQTRRYADPVFHCGCVLALCELVACIPAALVHVTAHKLKPGFEPKHGWELERQFGNYIEGRWTWILRNVKPVDPPVPAIGQRKLWDWQP